MASKTLTISADAYQRLVRLKRPHESFSDVVARLAGKADPMQFVGAISPGFADELKAASADVRRRLDADWSGRA
jgi:predicted CopG family antitoxin